jgi:hypothetical protein
MKERVWIKLDSSAIEESIQIENTLGKGAGIAALALQVHMANNRGVYNESKKMTAALAEQWGVRPSLIWKILEGFPNVFCKKSGTSFHNLRAKMAADRYENKAESGRNNRQKVNESEGAKKAQTTDNHDIIEKDRISNASEFALNKSPIVLDSDLEELNTNTYPSTSSSGVSVGKLPFVESGIEEHPIGATAAAPAAENVSGDTRVQAAGESAVKALKKASTKATPKTPHIPLTPDNFAAAVHKMSKYPLDMTDKFIDYWTEPDQKTGEKLRFEGEKYFKISSRLNTWAGKAGVSPLPAPPSSAAAPLEKEAADATPEWLKKKIAEAAEMRMSS